MGEENLRHPKTIYWDMHRKKIDKKQGFSVIYPKRPKITRKKGGNPKSLHHSKLHRQNDNVRRLKVRQNFMKETYIPSGVHIPD